MLLLQKLPDKKSEIINKFIAINEEINEILEKIEPDKKLMYDQDYIEELYWAQKITQEDRERIWYK